MSKLGKGTLNLKLMYKHNKMYLVLPSSLQHFGNVIFQLYGITAVTEMHYLWQLIKILENSVRMFIHTLSFIKISLHSWTSQYDSILTLSSSVTQIRSTNVPTISHDSLQIFKEKTGINIYWKSALSGVVLYALPIKVYLISDNSVK